MSQTIEIFHGVADSPIHFEHSIYIVDVETGDILLVIYTNLMLDNNAACFFV